VRRLVLLILAGVAPLACTATEPEPETPMNTNLLVAAAALVAPVSWSATGGTIAADGLYTAGGVPGNYLVIASAGTAKDTARACVGLPSTLVLDIHNDTIAVAGTVDLTATVTTSCDVVDTSAVVTWTSRTPSTASVASIATQVGRVTGVAQGTAWIVGVSGARRDSALICVGAGMTLEVTPATLGVTVGNTGELTASVATCSGAVDSTVTWVSRNTGIATVAASGTGDRTGMVTGVSAGSVYVVADEGTAGVKDSSLVTVTATPALSLGCPASGYLRLVNVSTGLQLTTALANAIPGDQIRVAAGTYLGQTALSRAGTAANRITVCGMSGVWPVLKGGRFRLSGSFITITGLVFEGPNNNDVNVYMAGPHDILFTGNIVRNSDWHAGVSVEDSYNVTISYNEFRDNGGVSGEIDHGLYYRRQATTASTRNYVVNNIIIGSVGRGISMHDNGGSAINYTTVAHNTIVRNGSTGILLALEGGVGNIIANNIVADNSLTYNYKQIRWKSGQAQVLNNITWSPTSTKNGIEALGGGSTASGNVSSDPLVVTPWTDLHLQAGSPAVSLGLPAHSVSPDYDGVARDATPDAGAYER
jgi:hypothetical protein